MTRLIMILTALVFLLFLGYTGFNLYINNVERPKFDIIKFQAPFSVRQYPPLNVAETIVTGKRRQALKDGFRILAPYIFKNKIPMTAPVMQQKSQNEWKVQFVMPSTFSFDALPTPDNSRIKITQIPVQKMLTIQFSGRNTDHNMEENLKRLQDYALKNGYTTQGEPLYAFYSHPWTLPFTKKNEIMLNLPF